MNKVGPDSWRLRDVLVSECDSNFEAASLVAATIGGTVAGDSMLPAHGGSKCNSIKAATQKSSTSFSSR
jgi:hypothetical protein